MLSFESQRCRLQITKIKMLPILCGKTLRNKIGNQGIQEIAGVENIREEKSKTQVVKAWGKMSTDNAPAIARRIIAHGEKIGRPKKR